MSEGATMSELLVQDVCDNPEHQYHFMDCGPDLEKVYDLTREPANEEILSHPVVVAELGARQRYGEALGRGLSDHEAREEGWSCE